MLPQRIRSSARGACGSGLLAIDFCGPGVRYTQAVGGLLARMSTTGHGNCGRAWNQRPSESAPSWGGKTGVDGGGHVSLSALRRLAWSQEDDIPRSFNPARRWG